MSRSETLHALTQLLQNGDEADRCYVSQALAKLTQPDEYAEVSSCLLPLLRDQDIDVCVDAATTLGKLGGEGTIDAMLESLEKDPDGEVKSSIARALGELGDEKAIPGLIRVMENRDEGIEIIEDGWDLWWDVQLAAVKSLGKLNASAAVPNLVELLHSDEGEDIEADILRALAQIDSSESIEALEKILSSNDSRKQRRAATALGNAQSAEAIRILGRALKSPHADVRSHTIQSLEALDAKRYLPAIMLLIKDPNEEVRRAAVHATTRLGDMKQPTQESIDLFSGLLNDNSALVRSTSLNTLANLDQSILLKKFVTDSEAIERVITLIGDADIETSTAATRLFSKLQTCDGEERLIKVLQDQAREEAIRRQAAISLGSMTKVGPRTVTALTKALNDSDKSVRLAALNSLQSSEPHYVAPEPETDKEPPLRPIEVILATIQCGIELTEAGASDTAPEQEAEKPTEIDTEKSNTTQSVPFDTLVDKASASTDQEVEITPPLPDFPASPELEGEQHESISTLDSIAMDNVEATLLGDESETESTMEFDEETKEYLGILEKNEETHQLRERRFKKTDIYTDVRRMAATMLGRDGSDPAIDTLTALLHDDDHEIRRLAADALAEIAAKNPANPALLKSQGTLISLALFGDPEIKMTAIRALGRMENRSAIPPLLDTLKDEDVVVRMETIRALASICASALDADEEGHMVTRATSDGEVLKEIGKALQDEQPSVRKYAADAATTLLRQCQIDAELPPVIIQKILDAGFAGAGEQARHMGQALRLLDSETSSRHLLPLLESMQSSAERRFVIEMLEEIHQPNENLQSPEQRLLAL